MWMTRFVCNLNVVKSDVQESVLSCFKLLIVDVAANGERTGQQISKRHRKVIFELYSDLLVGEGFEHRENERHRIILANGETLTRTRGLTIELLERGGEYWGRLGQAPVVCLCYAHFSIFVPQPASSSSLKP